MMTKYSPLKKLQHLVLQPWFSQHVPRQATQGSGSASSASAGGAGGSAASKYLVENVGDRVFFATDRSVLDASSRGTWCVRPNG